MTAIPASGRSELSPGSQGVRGLMMRPDRRPARGSTDRVVSLLGLLALAGCGPRDEPGDGPRPVAEAASPVESRRDATAADRGRQIFRTGSGPSGHPITARYGGAADVVPASVLVCANCHGDDGLGRPEGGIRPSNITWGSLTKPYAATTAGGRRRPPYTEEGLRRALTLGFDSGGTTLDRTMPRYQLSRDDLDDLVAYLKSLGDGREPGVTEGVVRVGVLLAPGSRYSVAGEPVREALSAYFDRLNEGGGIYGRRVELWFVVAPERSDDRSGALADLFESGPVFAVLSPFGAGAEAALADEAARRRIPVVGPLTPTPAPGAADNRYVFYLDAGVEGQARALVRFAAARPRRPLPTAAVLHTGDEWLRPVIEALRDEGRRAGWSAWREVAILAETTDLRRLAAELQRDGTAEVFALGLGDAAGRFLDAAAALGWSPELLLPGSLAGRAAFERRAGFAGRILVALPSLPIDLTPDSAEEYRDLARRRPLSSRQRTTHWPPLAAARVLTEGLRRAGRNASRERLVSELELLREYRTGYAPPLTFGPRRRVGAWGAYLIEIDPSDAKVRPVGGWQDVSPYAAVPVVPLPEARSTGP